MTQFVDAQAMAKRYPDTFSAPSAAELSMITPGTHVKVCVDDCERFWVLVTAVTRSGITGTVDNDLIRTHIHGLRYPDVVTFEPRHVYDILGKRASKTVMETLH
ncbi:hypothetical protein ACLLKL_001946 [Escherichia coli]